VVDKVKENIAWIAAVLGILTFIGIGPFNLFGSDQREIDSGFITELNSVLSSYEGDQIKVLAIHGDNEAFNYAKEIAQKLHESGFQIISLDSLITPRPFSGHKFEVKRDVLNISIGSKP